jgi:glycosyltransferase involved in cell wall biosynthesis
MSVYNGDRFLREAIDSILKQSFIDFEFIINDDASNDNTWDILMEYSSLDKRIFLLRNEINIGLTKSLNKCLAASNGIYIARQDDDDISLTDRIKRQVDHLDPNPEVVLVSSNFDRIDEEGHVIRRMKLHCEQQIILWHLIFYNYIGGHSQVMFRRDQALDLGGYSESYSCAQDYELWLRLSNLGKIDIINDTLLKYRVHDNRITSKNFDDQMLCVLNASRNHLIQLLGESISLSEIMQLWSFWCLTIPKDIPGLEIGKSGPINVRLKQIQTAFLAKQAFTKADFSSLNKKLNELIGDRYLKWFIIKLIKQHQLIPGFIMLYYAVNWLRFRAIKKFYDICKGAFRNYYQKSYSGNWHGFLKIK